LPILDKFTPAMTREFARQYNMIEELRKELSKVKDEMSLVKDNVGEIKAQLDQMTGPVI